MTVEQKPRQSVVSKLQICGILTRNLKVKKKEDATIAVKNRHIRLACVRRRSLPVTARSTAT